MQTYANFGTYLEIFIIINTQLLLASSKRQLSESKKFNSADCAKKPFRSSFCCCLLDEKKKLFTQQLREMKIVEKCIACSKLKVLFVNILNVNINANANQQRAS